MNILRWKISCDPAATKAAYSAIDAGVGCDCSTCRNFERIGKGAFPSEMHTIFDHLGIDFTKPAEVYHTYRAQSGFHCYGGWYHFFGAIEAGDDVHVPTNEEGTSFTIELEEVSERCRAGFTMKAELVNKAFAGRTVCQIEFDSELPWVLEEEAPG